MSQLITTPDGVEHEFPDSASDDVIKKALGNYSSGAPPVAAPVGGSPPVASAPTAPVDQPSRPVTPTPDVLSQARQSDADWLRIMSDAATGGFYNRGIDYLRGNDLQQAQAESARSRQGLAGTIPATAGMLLNPLTRLMGPANSLASATGQGVVQGGVSALGHGEDVPTGMAEGGAAGLGGGILGKAAGSIATKARNWWTGAVPTKDEVQQGIDQTWQNVNSARYSPRDVQATARASQVAASNHPTSPMTEITNPASKKLLDAFSDYSGDPTSQNSVRELRGWQSKAEALTGDDAAHGQVMSDRINNLLEGAVPSSTPRGLSAGDVQSAAKSANSSSELLDQYNKNLAANPQTTLGKAGDIIAGHSWGLGHHAIVGPVGAGLAGAAGVGGFMHGGVIPALESAGATLLVQPALNIAGGAMSRYGERSAADAAMRAADAANLPPRIDLTNPLHKLLLGGYLGQNP